MAKGWAARGWRLLSEGWLGWALYLSAALGITLKCFNYYKWYWGTYAHFTRSIEFCELKYCDFLLYYFEQAKVILHSHAPIPKYFYSPTFALFLIF